VTESGQAAELLVAKVGDEVPDLPARWPGDPDHGRPTLNGQTNQFARSVDTYVGGSGPQGPVTLDRMRAALAALFDRGQQEGRTPPLAALAASLRQRDPSDSRVLDVLLMLEDEFADHGL